MKAKDIKALGEKERVSKMEEMKKELMKVNSQIAIGTIPKSPGMVRQIRKNIARILTLNNQKTEMKEEVKKQA